MSSQLSHSFEPAVDSPGLRSRNSGGKKGSIAAEKRKLRNRLSQQAFRARQNWELNELKQRLKQFSDSESARNKRLAEENEVLRQRLWQCEKRLKSLQATLKSIVDSMTGDRESKFVGDENNSNASLSSSSANDNDRSFQNLDTDFECGEPVDMAMTVDYNIPRIQSGTIAEDMPFASSVDQNSGVVNGYNVIPPIETYPSERTLQMLSTNDMFEETDGQLALPDRGLSISFEPALTPFSRGAAAFPLCRNLQLMNLSKYSEHIEAYERCVMTGCFKGQFQPGFQQPHSNHLPRRLDIRQTRLARYGTMVQIHQWQRDSGQTDSMAAVPHPAIIDWCVFPFLRDNLIQYHSSDPSLDEICGHIGKAYVVQADLSELVANAEPLSVNFSVLDIVTGLEKNPTLLSLSRLSDAMQAESNNTIQQTARTKIHLPAPNLYALLHAREYTWELYRHLKIAEGGDRFRLDGNFFVKYPHLYEPEVDACYIAHGVPLRSCNKVTWPCLLPLDNAVVNSDFDCVTSRANLACRAQVEAVQGIAGFVN
ncbi:uncharacterized protein Z518_01109 [Rhinocladiella mackenziei CBS 650.93]|uniref:BZIP domain-containing protein n=1 Tax=Rhinocladiella mackenziei CBS 650.93 TaxID=1442369 RepID=A0A0D2HHD3_9EURO|nr:uncharacterized protein Z518_01109 [Rhinocladiella mackenziei CBS 650.93]KIX10028.1 hypothetical protein Z518_01109 [Rhinocladiella mackenziei CBS 650.93]